MIPDFLLTKGKPFEYQLTAYDQDDNDMFRFYSEDPLISIDELTGLFTFTPLVAGSHEVEFCVQDKYLAEDCKKMRFLIKDE